MKKIATYILVFSIILSVTVYAEDAISKDTVVERKFSEELNFLNSIGISNVNILSKDNITRGEFVSLVINSFYPEDVFYIKSGFEPFGEIDYEEDCPHIWMGKSI